MTMVSEDTAGLTLAGLEPDIQATAEGPLARTGALRGKHVVVMGINYAPEPTGIAPYTTGLARHLATEAASVSVLTGVPHYPGWRVEDYYRRGLRYRERGVPQLEPDVVRLRHHVPRRQTALTRAGYELSFLANALTTPAPHRPDLVVAVTPSLGGAVAGARLARRHHATLVVVVQDLMARAAGQSGISGGRAVAGITAAMERYALRRADQVAIVSESFRVALHGYGVPDERIHLMANWTHIAAAGADRQTARRALGWPRDAFIVAHTGNMGLKQDLGNVVQAARLLTDEAYVMLVGDGSQRQALADQASPVGNLRLVEPLDDAQYPLALSAADLLLVNERPSVGDMSLPSKLTSYFCAGRPVLAAVAPGGATAAELGRADGAGLVVRPGDPGMLADAIRQLRADTDLRAAMGRAAVRYAATLGRPAAMARLDAILAGALSADPIRA
jgi:colanic acid biosynthesis glycosyl transferase WcaI